MEAFLTSKGKRMIGWDEVLNNHLAPTSTIISYRGQETASEAANRGYNVVFTPGAALYFDWYQATPETQPRAMIGYSPIKKVYSIYPVAADSITALHNEELIQGKQLKPNSVQWVRPEKMKYVVGVQGCAWTEFMNDEKQLEYMIFPRLLAVAEMAWTQEKKRDWQDFKPRMNAHIPQLQARGINTFTLTDEIELTTRLLKPGKMEVVLDTEKYPVEIRYTLDGTNPTMSSLKYEKPFVIHDSVVVKAAIFREERMVEPILVQKVGVIEEITNYFEYIEPEHWKELNL
jgi:hexosaminidase